MLFIFRCKSIAECVHTEQIRAHNLTQWYKVNNDREKPCLVELTANYSSQKDKLFTISSTFALKALNPSCNVTTGAVCVVYKSNLGKSFSMFRIAFWTRQGQNVSCGDNRESPKYEVAVSQKRELHLCAWNCPLVILLVSLCRNTIV